MNRVLLKEFTIGTDIVKFYAQKNGSISVQIFNELGVKFVQSYYPTILLADAFIADWKK